MRALLLLAVALGFPSPGRAEDEPAAPGRPPGCTDDDLRARWAR